MEFLGNRPQAVLRLDNISHNPRQLLELFHVHGLYGRPGNYRLRHRLKYQKIQGDHCLDLHHVPAHHHSPQLFQARIQLIDAVAADPSGLRRAVEGELLHKGLDRRCVIAGEIQNRHFQNPINLEAVLRHLHLIQLYRSLAVANLQNPRILGQGHLLCHLCLAHVPGENLVKCCFPLLQFDFRSVGIHIA